jgi:Na+-transporting NADH:ubiquinone oxidoreductase subunit E
MVLDLVNIAVKAIFVENILLAFFLGMCSFLVISKRITSAVGLGLAVIFVLTITAPVNWAIHHFLLDKGALVSWLGEAFSEVNLTFLTFIIFIAVIAAMVQIVEMFIERFSPALYQTLGIFLPLITVNCAILGTSLFLVEREYNLIESSVFGFSSGVGWCLAIVVMAAIRKKLRYSNIPSGLRGLGITMIVTGLMAMAFMIFQGISIGE